MRDAAMVIEYNDSVMILSVSVSLSVSMPLCLYASLSLKGGYNVRSSNGPYQILIVVLA